MAKGTLLEITGQESGVLLYDAPFGGRDEAIVDNWSSDLSDHSCDLRKVRKVANCYEYLAERVGYSNYDESEGLQLTLHADLPDQDDLSVPGVLYVDVDGQFDVLVPDGWA